VTSSHRQGEAPQPAPLANPGANAGFGVISGSPGPTTGQIADDSANTFVVKEHRHPARPDEDRQTFPHGQRVQIIDLVAVPAHCRHRERGWHRLPLRLPVLREQQEVVANALLLL
jgi:hypothetical protein